MELYQQILLLFTCFAVLDIAVSKPRTVNSLTCQYENVTYSAKQHFKPDPCTFCKCPRRGGEVVCAIMDCKYEPHCLIFDSDPDVCCPRCLEYGCLHTDGKVYKRGEIVSRNNCTTCYCPASGGRTLCDVMDCAHPRCVDYVIREGSCCPVCPNGYNCQYNGTVINAGSTVEIGNRRCRCHRLKLAGRTSLFASCRKKVHW